MFLVNYLVQFDLLAASSDLHSVTSILFWDGPDRVVGECDFGGAENWQEGICQCCYATPFNQVLTFSAKENARESVDSWVECKSRSRVLCSHESTLKSLTLKLRLFFQNVVLC